MIDRKKVLAWLKICGEDLDCSEACPYYHVNEPKGFIGCMGALICDAKKVIEEQTQLIWNLAVEKKVLRDSLNGFGEEKHGHWIFDPNGMDWNIPAWCCSECDCLNHNIPPNLEKVNPLRWAGSKYCPNCGAKMDEEVKQDDIQ